MTPRLRQGFTLVEMLIALALLSLLALGMASALHSMGQAQERVDLRARRADELQATSAFLQDVMGPLSNRRLPSVAEGGTPWMFMGEPQAVQWLGVMPPRHGMGGRYFFRLSVEPVGAGQALVLRFQSWGGELQWPDWTAAPSLVLVSDITAFEVAYGGEDMLPEQWTDRWVSADALPSRMRLDIASSEGAWPLWIVATHVLSPGGGRSGTYVTGP